jgi:hypothetical protein
VTEHDADAPVPANVHGLVVKVPVMLEVNDTVPDGVLAVPAAVSVTVAVHVPATPTFSVVGHAIVVVVVLRLTVMLAPPLLARWLVSPG